MNKVKVLYILGYERSGSTILEKVLGQVSSFTACGELRYIWERGFVENHLCGYGKHFHDCDFWGAVVQEAFGGYEHVDGRKVADLQLAVDRTRYIPLIVSRLRPAVYQTALDEYRTYLQRLYPAIHQVAGTPVIIDSSKHDSGAYLVATLPNVELYILHLVRDSRGVAFSWQRPKRRPEITEKDAYLWTIPARTVAFQWTHRNLLSEFSRFAAHRYLRLRYEDFIAQPREIVERIIQFAEIPVPDLSFIEGHTIRMERQSPTVAGNPIRFETGPAVLREDMEWRERMSASDFAAATAISAPLLLRYGYQLRRSS